MDVAAWAYELLKLGGWPGASWWEVFELVREDVDVDPVAEACPTAASRSLTVSSLVERPEMREMSYWTSVGLGGRLVILELRLM